ncbi:MAG TPA: YdeI/OmpD-associated family protein [Sandaracinaceae bacterium]
MPTAKPIFFRSAAELRAWLEANHATATELWIGYYKKGTTKKGITYAEAVDEALCFGWIDGQARSIDAERYQQRFTPRRKNSNWSKINVAKAERLIAEGRMRPAGLAAFEARSAARTGVYSFEQEKPTELDPARLAKLRANPAARAFFEAQPPSYRRTAALWVMSAKKGETRDRRLETLIACSARGEVAPPFAFARNAKKRATAKTTASRRAPRTPP